MLRDKVTAMMLTMLYDQTVCAWTGTHQTAQAKKASVVIKTEANYINVKRFYGIECCDHWQTLVDMHH